MKRSVACLSFTLFAGVLLLASAPSAVPAQQPTLEDVLAKAAQYAAAFADPSRALVCEESYEHTYYRRMMNTAGGSERVPQNTRVWVAEKVVLATPDEAKNGFPWLEFRDIVTMDRKPVRDGASRLPKLLIEPNVPNLAEALQITKESTRSQAGRLERMVVLPRLASMFLHGANQPRFTFKKGGGRTIKGVKTVEVQFQEKGSPTILTGSSGQAAPSSGSFWIDPATGAVVSSFLKNGDSTAVYDELTITCALDPATNLWLPVSLVERMYDSEDEKEIDGKGTFKNWRLVPRGGK
jgi:hypothetical protein